MAITWTTEGVFLPTKYRAKPTYVGDVRFHSKKEARRYQELLLLFNAGVIRNLELQPKFDLHAFGGELVGKYIADFVYFEDEERVVEDVKGMKTALYKWKKKHVEAEYKLQIREVYHA